MAKSNSASNSLAEFGFDTEPDEFFGVKTESSDSQTSKTIKEVKKTPAQLDEEEDDGTETTNFDEETKKKGKSKTASGVTDNEDEDDLNPDNQEWFATPKKPSKTKKEEDEEEEPEETEVEVKSKAKKGSTKKEDEEEDENDNEENITVAKKKPANTKSEENEAEEDEDKKAVDEIEFYTTLAGELKEKGVLGSVTIKKGEKITEEKFFELQSAELEARLDESLEAFVKTLHDDPDAKDFIKFKKDGGKTADFIATYVSGALSLDKLDTEKPSDIRTVLSHYLTKYEKVSPEELEERLDYYKDKGQEKVKAELWFGKIKAAESKEKAALLKITETAKNDKEQEAREFVEEFTKVLEKTESVGVFPISKAERKEINTYINKATVKIGANRYVPPINAELSRILGGETEKDKKDLIILAKLLKNNFKIDDDLITEVETKVVKKAKSKLQEAKKGVKPSSSGSYTKRSMVDYFEEG